MASAKGRKRRASSESAVVTKKAKKEHKTTFTKTNPHKPKGIGHEESTMSASRSSGKPEQSNSGSAAIVMKAVITNLGILGRLPGELRNRIYALALDDSIKMPCRLFILLRYDSDRKIKGKQFKINTTPPPLLFTCHQIRTEAWHFYGQSIFAGAANRKHLDCYLKPLGEYAEHSPQLLTSPISGVSLEIDFQKGFRKDVVDQEIIINMSNSRMPNEQPSEGTCSEFRRAVQSHRRRLEKVAPGPVMLYIEQIDGIIRFRARSGKVDRDLERRCREKQRVASSGWLYTPSWWDECLPSIFIE